MKVLSRDFSKKEKILILFLVIVLIVLGYYQFIHKKVVSDIKSADAEYEALRTELTAVNAKVAALTKMQNEINDISSGGTVSIMPSYNNSKAVNQLLNDILRDTVDYSLTFADVTRNGDQIRRSVSVQFTARDYSTVQNVLGQLAESPYRCIVREINCTTGSVRNRNNYSNVVNVTATVIFYETMVGGTPDAGLPVESAK